MSVRGGSGPLAWGTPEVRDPARFVRTLDDDGSPGEYRATYTAYDGTEISPRLLRSKDLRSFQIERLAGPGIRNKGIALFPRKVGSRHLALLRSDGESTWLAASDDGRSWQQPRLVTRPSAAWEAIAVGNCGSPIETADGWLVLTHGVAPMRTYSIGAMLLDLEDPTQVVGRLPDPLLRPAPGRRFGYVPNVVYSCGAILHDGLLWIPFGENDTRICVAWATVDEVVAAMQRPASRR